MGNDGPVEDDISKLITASAFYNLPQNSLVILVAAAVVISVLLNQHT